MSDYGSRTEADAGKYDRAHAPEADDDTPDVSDLEMSPAEARTWFDRHPMARSAK